MNSVHPLHLLLLLTVVTAPNKSAVSSAVTRVEVLVESFRKKQPFTHFLSFPLSHPKIQEGFLRFKEVVLEQCSQVLLGQETTRETTVFSNCLFCQANTKSHSHYSWHGWFIEAYSYLCECRFILRGSFWFHVLLSSDAQDHGIDESIFQNPAKLHLTIGTLVLLNDTEVRKASEHLQECQNTIR